MFYKWVKDDVVNKPSNHEGNLNKLIHARQTLSLSNIHYWRQETNHNVQNEIQLIFTVPTWFRRQSVGNKIKKWAQWSCPHDRQWALAGLKRTSHDSRLTDTREGRPSWLMHGSSSGFGGSLLPDPLHGKSLGVIWQRSSQPSLDEGTTTTISYHWFLCLETLANMIEAPYTRWARYDLGPQWGCS